MTRDDLGQLALAALLTATAGWVDAVGYLSLGRVFVSFMSGDTTRLAVAGAAADAAWAADMAGLIALFVAGVAAGRLITRISGARRRPAVLIAEAVLLILAMFAPAPRLSIVGMALAMGAQNALIHRAGDTTTSLTYVTGTLVRFAERLVDAFWDRGPARWAWAPYLLQWSALLAGAVGGAFAFGALGLRALAGPIAVLCALVVVTWGTESRGGSL